MYASPVIRPILAVVVIVTLTLNGTGCLMTADENLWRDAPASLDAAASETLQPDLTVAPDQALPDGPAHDSAPIDQGADTLQPDTMQPDTTCPLVVLLLSAKEDDGQVEDDSYFHPDGETNGDIWIGSWGTMPVWGFFRFELGQAIPKGATISSATLELWGHFDFTYANTGWNPASHALEIYAEKSADPPVVTQAADGPFTPLGRPVTTTSVRWPASGGLAWFPSQYHTSPDFGTVLQELISAQGGLAAGAHIQIWVRGAQIATNHAFVTTIAYGYPGFKPARLTLSWCQ